MLFQNFWSNCEKKSSKLNAQMWDLDEEELSLSLGFECFLNKLWAESQISCQKSRLERL